VPGDTLTEGSKLQVLYSFPEARRALGGIGLTKLYELIDTGKVKRVHIGRRAFITAESVAAFVEGLAA
jgi:hypothetical protein